jgi:hypothetical protein
MSVDELAYFAVKGVIAQHRLGFGARGHSALKFGIAFPIFS